MADTPIENEALLTGVGLLRAKHAARVAVARALDSGRLCKPVRCARCRLRSNLQAHHHRGYLPEQWLRVVWLCAGCHSAVDKSGASIILPSIPEPWPGPYFNTHALLF